MMAQDGGGDDWRRTEPAMIGGLNTTRMRVTRARANRMRASVPAIGPWLPTATVHLAFLGVSADLCLLVLKDFWLVGSLLLAVAGTFVPNLVPRPCVIFVLGVSQFWREPSVTDPTFYVLLAGVHLLYVIDGLARQIPWHGRMQTAALVRPLKRFVLVQAVVQAVAVGALLAFGAGPGTVPGLSIFAAAALGVVAIVLARGLRLARGRD